MSRVNIPSIHDSWTKEDQKRAESEGWGIFDNGCYAEIQRIDAPTDGSEPIFDGDATAYDFVYKKAGTEPFYTLALLHINAANGCKEKIGAPSNDILTLIDGVGLNLPWKVSSDKVRVHDGEAYVILDTLNKVVAICEDGSIAATIREVVNASKDPSSVSMKMETFMGIVAQEKALRQRIRTLEVQVQPMPATLEACVEPEKPV